MARIVESASYGAPEVLEFRNVPDPQPATGEVRIRVEAIGLNRAESMWRNGAYIEPANLPARLGYEAAGTVDALGEGVAGFEIGEPVDVIHSRVPYHFSSQMSATTPNCKGFRPMKKAMRTLLAAAAFAIGVVPTVQAADITAMTGYAIKLNADSSALVYYTVAPDGFHVVVTTQQGRADRAAVERFETVLAAGQSAAVSVPRHAGEAPARMVLNNAGDRLHIAEPNAAVSVR